ncbi:MAG: hypothetical protein AAFN78_01885 [Pseudomonadota bacterium]
MLNRGTVAMNRKPGPAGLPFDRAIQSLTVTQSNFTRLDNLAGTVFVRQKTNRGAEADHRVRLRVVVKEKNTTSTRGSTKNELYLTYVVRDIGKGHFDAFFSDVEIISTITIRPNHRFDKLAAFAPLYAEFEALVKKHRNRASALKKFCNDHIDEVHDSRGVLAEVATDFTGIRPKTMQHEVTHARMAQGQTVTQLENLLDEFKAESRRPAKGKSAHDRAFKWIDAIFRVWDTDVGNKDHRKIVEHDCLFMIKMYEHFVLRLPEAADALSPTIVDELTFLAMHELSQPPPWN